MTSYASDYPQVEIDADVKKFFEEFYQTSDTAGAHEKYADAFTPDATLIMASKKVKGRDGSLPILHQHLTSLTPFLPHRPADVRNAEIIALRKSMWEKVASRHHKPQKVFPFGANADEVMLYGTVAYELKDGRSASVDWAARAHLVKEDGRVRMDFYQVYLVSVSMRKRGDV